MQPQQYGPPPYGPPGMAPPPPFADFQPPRPASGKAIASLICGVAGLLVCVVISLIGVVLGIIGITETGREGTRSGRGLAIAGTVVSSLSVVGSIAILALLLGFGRVAEQEQEQRRAENLDQDIALVIGRVQQYYQANNESLGPGGPVLAEAQPKPAEPKRGRDDRGERVIPNVRDGKVQGELSIRHLVRTGELSYSGNLDRWELVVTDHHKATIRARDWNGGVLREVNITDAATGAHFESRGTSAR